MNYLAILGAAVISFLFQWLWYGPLFGKKWMALTSKTPDSNSSMKMSSMLWGFVTTVLFTYGLAWVGGLMGLSDVMGALQLAFWVWLAFVVTTMAGDVLWEGGSGKLFRFKAISQLISIFVTALALVYLS